MDDITLHDLLLSTSNVHNIGYNIHHNHSNLLNAYLNLNADYFMAGSMVVFLQYEPYQLTFLSFSLSHF